jgi:hypothetical protein
MFDIMKEIQDKSNSATKALENFKSTESKEELLTAASDISEVLGMLEDLINTKGQDAKLYADLAVKLYKIKVSAASDVDLSVSAVNAAIAFCNKLKLKVTDEHIRKFIKLQKDGAKVLAQIDHKLSTMNLFGK